MEGKIRGSASSRKNGPPYREVPPVPERKTKSRARYTIVLISDSGASRQLELTSFRLRVCAAVATGVAVLLVVAAAGSAGIFSRTTHMSGQAGELAKTVSLLQEQLKEKQAALIVQERRVKELQELPTLTTVPSRSTVSEGPRRELGPAAEPVVDGPLTGLDESRDGAGTDSGVATRGYDRPADSVESRGSETDGRHAAALQSEKAGGTLESRTGSSTTTAPIIVFDAQGLNAALPNSKGKDILSFRLVKDRPDVRFTGYLFVFVEVIDSQGRSRIYAYPDNTRVGEENIPTDFQEGKGVAFKYNTRVELPLPEVEAESGASLAGVSVLLYGEDGQIVYQRGFDRKEVKIVMAKRSRPAAAGSGSRANRQAL